MLCLIFCFPHFSPIYTNTQTKTHTHNYTNRPLHFLFPSLSHSIPVVCKETLVLIDMYILQHSHIFQETKSTVVSRFWNFFRFEACVKMIDHTGGSIYIYIHICQSWFLTWSNAVLQLIAPKCLQRYLHMLQHGPPVSTCQYGSTFLLTTACLTKSVSEQGRFGGLSAVVSSLVSAYWKPRTINGLINW